ncbi:MAG: hypothetical protein NC244_07735 [Alistipes senegalensis]|nr:hypothetical protein [Alistipes senegalensis]
MNLKQPNHICKNINCPNGVNGEPKHYYACDYCDKINQWKSVACCPDCYDAYMEQIVEQRAKNKKVDLLPNRTDKTKEEVQELLNKPVEIVLEETKQELGEYLEEGLSIPEAVEKINSDIDKNTYTPRKKNKRKNRNQEIFINYEVGDEE